MSGLDVTDSFTEGSLSAQYTCADTVALSSPEVYQLLCSKRDDMLKHDAKSTNVTETPAFGRICKAIEHHELLLRQGATSYAASGAETVEMRLANGAGAARLEPYEGVSICTLVPRTVEEAVALLPTLARFMPEDLAPVLRQVRGGFRQQRATLAGTEVPTAGETQTGRHVAHLADIPDFGSM